MKRLFDIVSSTFALTCLLPLIALIWFMVFWKLGRPVIFSQRRPGLHGKVFTLYKFRTMKEFTSALAEETPDEDRATPFGELLRRTSLDELPELWNVIKGDMSLVGPRPLLVEYLDLYTASQMRRHSVRPGITGWAQVNGRNAISWKKKFEYDLWYVEHQSMLLDLKIIWMTIGAILRCENINQPGKATAEKFNGDRFVI